MLMGIRSSILTVIWQDTQRCPSSVSHRHSKGVTCKKTDQNNISLKPVKVQDFSVKGFY